MSNYKKLFTLTAIALLAVGVFTSCKSDKQATKEEYVVILSMDAYRWDYPDIVHTPNLNAIAENGVKSQALIPCYPSKTFPNHYSIATGLYPDNHGIVNNSFH